MLTKRQSQIAQLESYLGEITGSDTEAASSLIDQYKRRGTLSDKQWKFVASLVSRWCK